MRLKEGWLTSPLVSVVTSVFNGERWLAESLRSVLRQEDVDLELVVVNDGSTDGSARVLAEFVAADRRVRVLEQENQGLTRALDRGCSEARGVYIARHDSDDISLPGRFARQAELLGREPSVALVGSWVKVLGPVGEVLYEMRRPEEMVFPTPWVDHPSTGPMGHGSAMFRRRDYEAAGGYRDSFYWVQDVDLWLRLTERGAVACVPQFLYAFRLAGGCISLRHVREQARLDRIAYACAGRRRERKDESDLLAEAREVRPGRPSSDGGGRTEDGDYFVGKCLLDRRDRRAVEYLRRSTRRRPGQPRGWASLALAWFTCWRDGETLTA